VHLNFEVEDLKKFAPDYVVVGNFIRRDNPQAQYVIENKIPYGSFPSTLENFFLGATDNIVITGTHGKTTTTACMAYLLDHCKRDPSFLVGGIPVNFEKSFHVGKGKNFVLEGDEYDTAFFDKESKFLHYRPKYAVLTSMEYDHADIFSNEEAMVKMFRKFIHLIPKDGFLYYCRDWDSVHSMVVEERIAAKAVSYGFHADADHRLEKFENRSEGLRFQFGGTDFENEMTGSYNALNFASTILIARQVGLKDAEIFEALKNFKGVKRRQEVRARIGHHLVLDDFAHHPTAVRETLKGLKAKYPEHRLVVFFEPRSNTSRRNIHQKEYEAAFLDADVLLMAPVFKAEAFKEEERLNIEKICQALRVAGRDAMGPLNVDQMVSRSIDLSKERPCLFAILSNGSFDQLHEKLISELTRSQH
jgi:UDP-N-acetylmuramate: L-alanyl-gamma-D-glutamyl-meso-diaminopimelate ligase